VVVTFRCTFHHDDAGNYLGSTCRSFLPNGEELVVASTKQADHDPEGQDKNVARGPARGQHTKGPDDKQSKDPKEGSDILTQVEQSEPQPTPDKEPLELGDKKELRIETYNDTLGEKRFRVIAGNGEIIAVGGEGIKNAKDRDNVVKLLQDGLKGAKVVENKREY
jgi:uncharacterized protein YegP (UPF0339 family)